MNQVFLSTASSSGTRKCFYCGELITDRTLLIETLRDFQDPLTFHISCFKSFLSDLNKESNRF